ncbi:MAG: hypothetical protein JWM98_2740 [Thermoleophilia bacterium]|nr:hypothetical protein [Thermoleophilia bacterium]
MLPCTRMVTTPPTSPPPPGAPVDAARSARERGSSMVEYVGLGAVATMLVSGIATAIDSTAGDRLGAAIVRRLIDAISGSG